MCRPILSRGEILIGEKTVAKDFSQSAVFKNTFLISQTSICCQFSKEPSPGDGSFEHP